MNVVDMKGDCNKAMESLTVDGAAVDNVAVDCAGSCAELLILDPQLVVTRGLQPSAVARASSVLSVPADPAVLIDGTGAARGPGSTLAGAIASCP